MSSLSKLSIPVAPLVAGLVIVTACSQDPSARARRYVESGNRYFEQQKYREASVEYRNAVQADPRAGTARQRLADTYARLGDASKALEEYVRAADLLPTDAAVQVRAGNYLLAARRFEDAKSRAEAALKTHPHDIDAHVLLGNSLAGLRNLDEAIAEIDEAIKLDPDRGATYANLGMLRMSRGDYEAAETALKRSVELAPHSLAARLALAHYYWASRKLPEAERELRGALAVQPGNPTANRAMALYLVSRNRGAEAEPYVKKLAGTGAAPFALADFYLHQKRAGEAIAELQQLRTQERLAVPAGHRLAQAYAVHGDRAEAERVLGELLAKDPRDAQSLLIQGELLAQEGRREDALAKFKAAAEIDAASPRLQFALGRGYAARGDLDLARAAYAEVLKLNPSAAAAQMELSRLNLLAGRPEDAVRLSREAVKNEPKSLDARIALVRALIARGDLVAADQALDGLEKAAPEVAAVHVQKALAAMARKNWPSAHHSLQRALAIDPASFEALNSLVVLDLLAGNPAAAKARVDSRLQGTPDRADLLIIAATVAASGRDLPAAEAYLLRAIQADPAALPAYMKLGRLYVSQRRLPEARREFQALVDRQAKPVAALTMLGILEQAEGNEPAAQKHYESVLHIDPRSPVAANNLAWMYAEKGTNLETALDLAQRAAEAMPKVAEAQDTLGWVYFKRQTYDRAIAVLRETVALSPRTGIYHYHLGLAYEGAGDVGNARASLQQALAVEPSFPGAADARRRVGQLAAR